MPKKTDLEVKDLATAEAAFAAPSTKRHTTVVIDRRVHLGLPLGEQRRIRVRALPTSHPLSSTHREVHQIAQDRQVYVTDMRDVLHHLRMGTLPRMSEIVYQGLTDVARTLLITERWTTDAPHFGTYRLVIGTHPDINDTRVRYVSNFAEILDVLDQGLRPVIHQVTAHANISPRVRASLLTTPWVNNYAEVTGLVRDEEMLTRTVEYVNSYKEAFEALCRGERPVLSRWYFEERMSQETRLALVYGNYGDNWVEIIDDPRRPEIAEGRKARELIKGWNDLPMYHVRVKTVSQIEHGMSKYHKVLISTDDLQRLPAAYRSRMHVVPYSTDPDMMHIIKVESADAKSARAVENIAAAVDKHGHAIISEEALQRLTLEDRKRLTLTLLLTGKWSVSAVRPVDGLAGPKTTSAINQWVKTPEEAAQRLSRGLKAEILRSDFLALSMDDRRRLDIASARYAEVPQSTMVYTIRRVIKEGVRRSRVVRSLVTAERALEQGYHVLIADDVLDTWTPENRERITTTAASARLTRFLPRPELEYSEILVVRSVAESQEIVRPESPEIPEALAEIDRIITQHTDMLDKLKALRLQIERKK